jgi:hypothetical protein
MNARRAARGCAQTSDLTALTLVSLTSLPRPRAILYRTSHSNVPELCIEALNMQSKKISYLLSISDTEA